MPQQWILLVDDESLMLGMLEEFLQDADCMVTTASDAMQSFIQARDLKPALVISDFQMPNFGTGDVALRELRKDSRFRSIPFIFVTATDLEKVRSLLPPNDPTVRLLGKPVDWEQLRTAIAEMTGIRVPRKGA